MSHVIPFPDRVRLAARLTVRDRIAIFRWEAAEQAAGRLGRVALHEDVPCEGDERVDFALVYRPASRWADWGVRRGVNGMAIWRCTDGAEAGPFATAEDALAALTSWMREPHSRVAPQAGTHTPPAFRAPSVPASGLGCVIPFPPAAVHCALPG